MTPTDDERVADLIAELNEAVAMSEDTAGLVEKYFVADRAQAMVVLFNRGEYEHLPMILAPDHVHDMRPVHIPGMGVYRGREEYAKFIEDWVDAFPNAGIETESELRISEPVDAVFAVLKQVARGSASDVPIAFRYAMFAEYSNERHESVFGTDLEEMRGLFRERYEVDPGPFELEMLAPEAKQEA